MAIKHLKPKTRKEIALAKASMTEDERIEEFIFNTGSAMEIYLPEYEKVKLYNLVVNKKYKLKIISFDGFGDQDENEEQYARKVHPWLKKGWEEFWHEDNYSSQEVILIHKPEIKEDAMGGVSSPMATLNNTPGMGNVVPAGTNSFGSGDKFGNTIGGKPYTQAGSPKRRKKKTVIKKKAKSPLGAPKLEEENINPYDKIGTMMAKKAKVPMTFKKKKSKGNQNAMVQKKFEHEIITFDEFKKLMD